MADSGKIDPMQQFEVAPIAIAGQAQGFEVGDYQIFLTNSALWMVLSALALAVFMIGGTRGAMIPGRWQLMVESAVSFISNMTRASIGDAGRKYTPYVFSLFMFILLCNMLGMLPIGLLGLHPFTVTSHIAVTGVLAALSFAIVLIVGFWKHGLRFFSLFLPSGTPWPMIPVLIPIEIISFIVRPFSLALRLFVAMTAGHVLLKVLAGFVISSGNAGAGYGVIVGLPSLVLMIAISALELLVAGIQAYVFALLTTLYISEAEHLH